MLTGLDKFQMLVIQVQVFDPCQPLLEHYIILQQVPFVKRLFSVTIFTFLYDLGFLSRVLASLIKRWLNGKYALEVRDSKLFWKDLKMYFSLVLFAHEIKPKRHLSTLPQSHLLALQNKSLSLCGGKEGQMCQLPYVSTKGHNVRIPLMWYHMAVCVDGYLALFIKSHRDWAGRGGK